MKILPTMAGGLRVDLEAERDFTVFEHLIWDARGKKEGWLARRLGVLMEDDWNEYVVPDLANYFDEQIEMVVKALRTAKEGMGGNGACFFIEKGEGEKWYGVLNQARLSLESQWKLAGLEDEGLERTEEEERLSAFLRSRFYLLLQTKLLDHVM